MLKRNCSGCDKRIERKFNYCPHCGDNAKSIKTEDYGMFGTDDKVPRTQVQNEIKLPFGMNKIIGSLVKQLEKQMENMDVNDVNNMMPKGFKIKVTTGNPQNRQQMVQNQAPKPQPFTEDIAPISEKEKRRRASLERVDAISKVRRLADKIIYEIEAPGISKERDVAITELASGLEIKIYSKDYCFVKFIPIKVEVIGYEVGKDKVFLELKA